jgi:hypothetical protein
LEIVLTLEILTELKILDKDFIKLKKHAKICFHHKMIKIKLHLYKLIHGKMNHATNHVKINYMSTVLCNFI